MVGQGVEARLEVSSTATLALVDAQAVPIAEQQVEAVVDDVGNKVGEMEQFMSMSENFMQSIDLQNGVFEEQGLKMLEKKKKEGISILLGTDKQKIIDQTNNETEVLDLNPPPVREPEKLGRSNQYDIFFE